MAEFIAYLNRDPASSLITPGTGATDGLEARVAKVEGVLARICPEADEQTDGKGRTLVQIDREISDLCEIAQVTARRVTKLESFIAASVPVPAKVHVRSDAASTNEAATEAAAVDEGWREMLVPVSFTHEDSLMWWMTPDRKAYTGHCLNPSTDWGTFDSTLRDFVVVTDSRKDDPVYLAVRSKIAPPPNLAEWYKPGAKAKPDEARQCVVCRSETEPTYQSPDGMHGWFCKAHALSGDEIREAIPSAYRIPGTTLAGCVRNLASAHDTALKVNAELSGHIGTMRGQLAAAQAATVAAEGRAETARRHAADAEAKLAELRADIENVRASLGK